MLRLRSKSVHETTSNVPATFRLIDANGDTVTYPQSKLIHIAGMVRHLAIEAMRRNPPIDLRGQVHADWLRAYVSGHQSSEDRAKDAPHTQLSYVPLQSIGIEHTDPDIRRVMIIAPVGDDAWLNHLARTIDGQQLTPTPGTTLPPGTRLEIIDGHRKDGVRDAYIRSSTTWASVTPVILPGHVDGNQNKARKLIEKALVRAGLTQPCEFEWSHFSAFRNVLSAHKYRKDPDDPTNKIQINYVRPDHLLQLSAVHLILRFGRREDSDNRDSRWIPAEHATSGPVSIGVGRHCGLGMFAALD